ncbi:Crotonobetainyl-CoA:carnitine CoA-transferase CaiB [Sphingomonas guangdongensis]|uniref:Crotonobetainyl-CoA:carnitine CoA-transferase CaiB n=1 Tax=Sphingomonas guangdongensis TaxID=1141890 RepID=A0A285QWT3_9SPHN|nr:CoA transferase [Sphingomonas guangdongensis]SOB86383.1 Crotonobetainyl-CoA:carnitine CoA-transferase CaiB [Sphingomonas guangdongensis]
MLDLIKGVRVLDMTTVVLGPYATQILGDLGADVTKVEPLTGDVFRAVRPGHSADMGAGFLNLNRNKRSLAVDLRHPEGQAIIDRLVADADVLVHNMRLSSAERLGIGWDRLRAINPRLVYCFTAGYGEGGRDENEPAYDDIVQARSGIARLNAGADGAPRFLQTIIADKVGGLHLALATLGGLLSRARTGEGVKVEAPMFESLVSFLLVEQLAGRSFAPPLGGTGYDRLSSPFRKPHRTADGFISLLPYTTAHWVAFLRLIGRDDLTGDPRVVDPVVRSRSIDTLYAIIADAMPARATADWLQLLRDAGIPSGPVNALEDLFDDPHLADVGLFRAATHETEGELMTVRSPFRTHGGGDTADRLPARLGGDTRAVLRAAGYDDVAIDALIAGGVIAEPAAPPPAGQVA